MDADVFTSHLQSILPKLTSKQVFIVGDCNINLLHYDEHALSTAFVNHLFSYNFLPCMNHPTRTSEHSSTIIGSIFINLINAKVITENVLTQISDHLPQILILKNANIPQHNLVVFISDYSRDNEGNFVSDFNEI